MIRSQASCDFIFLIMTRFSRFCVKGRAFYANGAKLLRGEGKTTC